MKNVSEVFEEIEKAKNDKDRVLILKFNSSWALRNVLQGTFDPRIQFTVTKIPDYKRSNVPVGFGYSTIHKELERIYLFQKDNPKTPPNLTEQRKNEILIQMLEVLEEKEAKVFENMLTKNTKAVKNLNYTIVKQAFPDLLP